MVEFYLIFALKLSRLLGPPYIFIDNKAPEISNNPKANQLYDRLFHKVVENCQKLFLFSRMKAETDVRVQELWHYRFMHLVNANYNFVDEDLKTYEYVVYSMDYGKLLSVKAQESGTGAIIINTMIKQLDEMLNKADLILSSDRMRLPLYSMNLGGLCHTSLLLSLLPKEMEEEYKKKLTEILTKKLRKEMIASYIAEKGVEIADFSNVRFLIEQCVYDDLLDEAGENTQR
jgi:hypothetical protein